MKPHKESRLIPRQGGSQDPEQIQGHGTARPDFVTWVLANPRHSETVRWLAWEIRTDPPWPVVKTLDELLGHMDAWPAFPLVREAVIEAWAEYEREVAA